MYEELQHHGVKGMKWGVRRVSKAVSKTFDRNVDNGKNKPKISPAEKILKDSIAIASNASDIKREMLRSKRNSDVSKKAKELSDYELKKIVDRLRLERSYSELITSQNVQKGKSKVDSYLSTAGSIIGIASGAVGIANTIKKLLQ